MRRPTVCRRIRVAAGAAALLATVACDSPSAPRPLASPASVGEGTQGRAEALAQQMAPLFRPEGQPLRGARIPGRAGAVVVHAPPLVTAQAAVRGPDGRLVVGCVGSAGEAESFFRLEGDPSAAGTK